jgi:hypothetical protein
MVAAKSTAVGDLARDQPNVPVKGLAAARLELFRS